MASRAADDAGDADGPALGHESSGVGGHRQEEAPPARRIGRARRNRLADQRPVHRPARASRRAGSRRGSAGGTISGRRRRRQKRESAPPRTASERAAPHWLAQMIRAIQSMSAAASERLGWSGLSEASSTARGLLRCRIFAITSPSRGLDHDAVAAPDRRVAGDDDRVAVAIERHHRIAAHLEGEDVVAGARETRSRPSPGRPESRHRRRSRRRRPGRGRGAARRKRRRLAGRGASPRSRGRSPISVPVASRILAMLSVEGQRGRPSAEARFDLLKVVGSSPARRARPGRRQPVARGEPVDRRPDAGRGTAPSPSRAVRPGGRNKYLVWNYPVGPMPALELQDRLAGFSLCRAKDGLQRAGSGLASRSFRRPFRLRGKRP